MPDSSIALSPNATSFVTTLTNDDTMDFSSEHSEFNTSLDDSMHNGVPCLLNVSTPDPSALDTSTSVHNLLTSQHGSQYSEGNFHPIDAITLLHKIRIRNINKLIIGSLNINSLANKIEQLKLIIKNNLDVLIIVETKLDDTFSTEEFLIEGFCAPFRLDRNRNGGRNYHIY